MSGDVDTSRCLTKVEAAKVAGTSTKGIERAVQRGDLVQHWRPQKGGPDVAVYFPDEVAALAADRATRRRRGPSGGVLMPGRTTPPTNGNGHGATGLTVQPVGHSLTPPVLPSSGDELLTLLVAVARQVVSQTSETSQTSAIFLTVAEASAVSGLSQAFLKRMIEAGTLSAVRDRGWRIRRKDLEAL